MEVIRIDLVEKDAADLTAELEAKGVEYQGSTARHMTGEAFFVSVIVPATLTVVQIIAGFLIARKYSQSTTPNPTEIKISINGEDISAGDFPSQAADKLKKP